MSAIHVLDEYIRHHHLKNDAALSRMLEVSPPVISKLRSGLLQLRATMILRMHEAAPEDFPVKRIRDLLGA